MWYQGGTDSDSARGAHANVPLADLTEGELLHISSIHMPVYKYNTKQYEHFFFVYTVVDWKHLEENIVKAGSASAFTSALGRSKSPAP